MMKSILKKRDDMPSPPELGELRDLPDSPTPCLPSQRSRSGATNVPQPPPLFPSSKIGTTHVVKVPNMPPLPRKPFSEPDIFSSFKGSLKRGSRSKLGLGAPRTRTKLYASPPPRDKSGGLMRRLSEEFVKTQSDSVPSSLASESSLEEDQSCAQSFEYRPWEGLYPGVVEQMRIDVEILDELGIEELAHLIFVMADKIKSEEQAGKSKAARILQLERELGKTAPFAAIPVITVLDEDSREVAPEATETFNETPSYLDEDSELPQLRSQILVRDTQIGILERSIEERDAQIEALEAQVAECEAQACAWAEKGGKQQLALVEKERTIANLQVAVEEQRAAATEARKQLKTRDAVHARLSAEVEERERMNLALQAEVEARESEVAALKKQIEECDSEIVRLEELVEEREDALAEAMVDLGEFQALHANADEDERYADAESLHGSEDQQPWVSTHKLLEGMEALRAANDEAAADLTSARAQLRDALKTAAEFKARAATAEDEADKARSAADRAEATLRKTRTLVAESHRQAHESLHRAQTSPPSPPSSGASDPSPEPQARSAVAESLAAELATAHSHSASLEERLSALQLSLEAAKLDSAKFERLYEAHSAEAVAASRDLLDLKDEIEKLRAASADADMKAFALQKTVQDLELKNEEMAVLIGSYEIERQLRTPRGTPRGTPKGTPRRAGTPRTAGTPSLRQLAATPKNMRGREASGGGQTTPTPTPSRRKFATPAPLPAAPPKQPSSTVARSASLREAGGAMGPLRSSTRANVSSASTDSAEADRGDAKAGTAEVRSGKEPSGTMKEGQAEKKERRSSKTGAKAPSKLPQSRFSLSRPRRVHSGEEEL